MTSVVSPRTSAGWGPIWPTTPPPDCCTPRSPETWRRSAHPCDSCPRLWRGARHSWTGSRRRRRRSCSTWRWRKGRGTPRRRCSTRTRRRTSTSRGWWRDSRRRWRTTGDRWGGKGLRQYLYISFRIDDIFRLRKRSAVCRPSPTAAAAPASRA